MAIRSAAPEKAPEDATGSTARQGERGHLDHQDGADYPAPVISC